MDFLDPTKKIKFIWVTNRKVWNSRLAIIILAILSVAAILLSVALIFALIYPQTAADDSNAWPQLDKSPQQLYSINVSHPKLEKFLPSNVTICQGKGFACASSPIMTISINARCDGVVNCPDGSDEAHCQECLTAFSCLTFDGKRMCYRAEVLCDGIPHCSNESDEKICSRSACTKDTFQCRRDGWFNMCLPQSLICDGESHCEDSSDEKNCDGNCKNGSIWCKTTKSCIPKWKKCDGHRNCPDGSDETGCTCEECSGEAICKWGEIKNQGFCITQDRICDGQNDCPNGYEEDGCHHKSGSFVYGKKLSPFKFL